MQSTMARLCVTYKPPLPAASNLVFISPDVIDDDEDYDDALPRAS